MIFSLSDLLLCSEGAGSRERLECTPNGVTRIYSLAYLCIAHTGDSTVIHRPEQVGLILKSLKILV